MPWLNREPTIDDPNGCVDAETRRASGGDREPRPVPADAATRRDRWNARLEMAGANLKRVRDAGIPIVLGTDAGNPLTLHGPSVLGELEAMQAAGLSASEVLLAATRDAAPRAGKPGEGPPRHAGGWQGRGPAGARRRPDPGRVRLPPPAAGRPRRRGAPARRAAGPALARTVHEVRLASPGTDHSLGRSCALVNDPG